MSLSAYFLFMILLWGAYAIVLFVSIPAAGLISLLWTVPLWLFITAWAYSLSKTVDRL